jgi:uncharacterized membrane protein YuzA (DUF378 family)
VYFFFIFIKYKQINKMDYLTVIVQILLVAGAINWGLVALNDMDIVDMLTGGPNKISQIVKLVVGAAGLYQAYVLTMTV